MYKEQVSNPRTHNLSHTTVNPTSTTSGSVVSCWQEAKYINYAKNEKNEINGANGAYEANGANRTYGAHRAYGAYGAHGLFLR